MGIPGGEREKGTKEIFKTIMTGNFLRIYVRHQTTNPGSSENSEYDKYQETTCRHIIVQLQKIKGENPEKALRKNSCLPTTKAKVLRIPMRAGPDE